MLSLKHSYEESDMHAITGGIVERVPWAPEPMEKPFPARISWF